MSRDINAYLTAFKEKKLRQKERKKAEKKKATKEKQSQLKRVEKLKKKEATSKLIKQLQQLNPKSDEVIQPVEIKKHINIYHNCLIEKYADEEDLYTKEELMNIETLYPNEEGRINWDVWNKMVSS